MEPLLLRQSNGEEPTTNISRVFNIESVVKVGNTILDIEFQKSGAEVKLPVEVEGLFGPVSSIKLPPCPTYQDEGMVVLDDIAVRVNNLLRVIKLVEQKEKQPVVLKKSVRNLQLAIVSRLVGKSGTVCRDVLGRRVSNTCRAVLLPSYSHDPSIAFVPSSLMSKMNVRDNNVIIVGRDPTIWHGSIEVLKAQRTDGSCIRLHPFIFKQFGADCDGDCVWAMAIPEELQAKMQHEVLSFAKKHAKSASLVGSGSPPCDINWEKPQDASQKLWMSSGFSISPEDILNDTDDLSRFRAASGKNIGEEARQIANGNDVEMILNYLNVVNLTMLIQKIYLGPVGAAAQKMKLIGARDRRLVESANYMSEQTQQRLFDIKGSVQGDQKDLAVFFDLLHIVNMTGPYSSQNGLVTDEQVLKRLQEIGIDSDRARPIIVFLYSVYGMIETAIELSAGKIDDKLTTEVCYNVPSKMLDGASKDEVVTELSGLISVSKEHIMRKCRQIKSFTTLGSVLDDPLYNLINPFSDTKTEEALVSLRNRLDHSDRVVTFTRLTDTILDLSLESSIAATTSADAETETVGVQLPRDSRGGREPVLDLPRQYAWYDHEEGEPRT